MAEAVDQAEPRPFWSGTISFGLVSVPVDLYPAVRPYRVPLRMLGPEDQPLQRRYFCSADGKALGSDDVVRGYEWQDGSFTTVTEEELAALAPAKSRDIDLRRFVPRTEIPTQLLDRPYVLAPAGASTKAYTLLADTMEQRGRAGIATFVMRGKEYLAAIFSEQGLLRAVTMHFVDELRTPEAIGLPTVARVSSKTVRQIEGILDKLVKQELPIETLHDEYSAALRQLAEKKLAAGRDVVEVEETPSAQSAQDDVIDIMSILKQRMAGKTTPGPRKASAEREGKRDPHRDGLEGKAKKELYEQAKELDVPNRSKLSKDELIHAIRRAS